MKEVFSKFLAANFSENYPEIIKKFELYQQLLITANQNVNLISRKTSSKDYWTLHFLDSILPFHLFEFENKRVLDFGTGGGLPGIPLKLIFPKVSFYFLDSRLKKIEVLKNIIKKLDLKKCFTIVSRLEEVDIGWSGYFDFIISRSVKFTPRYYGKMLGLLSDNGIIILYKGPKIDDLDFVDDYDKFDVSHPQIGKRNIIIIKKRKN